MPRARSKRLRLHQVHRWLQARFPCPRRTVLRVEKLPHRELGACDRVGKELVLRVSPTIGWESAIEILLHEYAHAMTWPLAKHEHRVADHSDEWGLAYAKLYRAFQERGGDLEANNF